MFSQYGGTVGSPLLLEPSEEETEKERRNYWYRFSIMYTGMLTTGTSIVFLYFIYNSLLFYILSEHDEIVIG